MTSRTRFTGGVRSARGCGLEKELSQLKGRLKQLSEENNLFKNELRRFRATETHKQPRKDVHQNHLGHTLFHMIDSEQNNSQLVNDLLKNVEERFTEIEKRIENLERNLSNHQPNLGVNQDERRLKVKNEKGVNEHKRSIYFGKYFNRKGYFYGNRNQSRTQRLQNCFIRKTKATPKWSINKGGTETIQNGACERLNEHCLKYERSFKCEVPQSKFFHLCLRDTMKNMLKSVEVSEFVSNETKIAIRFYGSKYKTDRVFTRLQDMKQNVTSETWSLWHDFKNSEILLIENSFKNGLMKDKVERYKCKDKCLVQAEFPAFVALSELNKNINQAYHLAQLNINSKQPKFMKAQTSWSVPVDKFGFVELSAQKYFNCAAETISADGGSSEDFLDSHSMTDIPTTGPALITITTLKGDVNLESTKCKIVKDIREACLHVDYFKLSLVYNFSAKTLGKILKEAMRLFVWTQRSINLNANQTVFKLTGEKTAIAQMKVFILTEYVHELRHVALGSHFELQYSQREWDEDIKDIFLKEEERAKETEPKFIEDSIEITLLQVLLLKPSFSDFKNCMIHVDFEDKVLILRGTDSAIRDCREKLISEINKIKEESIVISFDMKSILLKEKGRNYLKTLNSSDLKEAKVILQDSSLLLAAKEEKILSSAVKMLRGELDFVESVRSEVVIPHDRLISLKYHIENGLLVHVTFDDNGKIIKLLGIEDDVLMARRDVEKLLEEFGVYEKSFHVGEPEAKFLYLCCEDRIKSCLKSVDVTELTLTESKVSIRYKGCESKTHQAHNSLQVLKNNILLKTWNLSGDFRKHELFLLANSLKNGKMKEQLENYIYAERILVIPTFPDLKPQLSSATKHQKDKTKMPKSRPQDCRPFCQEQSTILTPGNKLVFDISNTCQLVIKPYGDIIKEKSDILVSLLGPEKDMRKTRVGCVFNKTCPDHWTELQTTKESNPSAPVLTVKNPKGLKCLAVCHVILSIWNPSSSPQQLNVAFQTVLNEAKNLGAKSISFPALGCGRAFQFPPLNVAQQVLTSIRAMNVGTFLNKVVLLAPDKEFFKALKSELPNHFNSSLPNNTPAPPPPPTPTPPAPTVAKEDSDEETDDSESSDDGLEVSNLIDINNSNSATLTIITLHGNKTFETIKKIIAHDIRELCLHADYFKQNIINYWPRESRQKILNEAMKLYVWVERSIHPKTKHVGFKLTGEKPSVAQMKAIIHQEFLVVLDSRYLSKQNISSDEFPRRGTVEFMRCAADSDEIFPSYWSLNNSQRSWNNLQNTVNEKEKYILVSVDKDTKDAITKLVTQTLDKSLVGQGNDAAGIQYSSLQVLDVKRVENPDLFEVYRFHRKRLFENMVRRGHICPDIGKLRGSKGRVCTTELLSDSMKKELYYEINEHYLFHGTKPDTIEALIHNGLDPRLSNDGAIFGKGIYAAERATKSDQYTDSKLQRTHNGTKLHLILTRMLLGNVFLCNDNHRSVQGKGSKKLSRPPCMSCFEDVCRCRDQTLFDSVMGDGKWLFREFVVYESSQCYPEYVITYTRV